MNKRAIICGLALLMAAASFSCGKTEPQAEISSSETETTQAEETTASDGEDTNTNKKKSSSGFGMMGYVKKSHQVSANVNAKSMHHAFTAYLVDNQLMADTDIIYSNTAVCDMSKEIKEYLYDEKDYDFIIKFDESHMPETILVPYYEKNNFVGSYPISDEYDGMKWSEALEKYGFKAGEYTDIPLVESEDGQLGNTDVPEHNGLDLNDPDILESCQLAVAIGWEYNSGENDMPVYLYGKWNKDTPFVSNLNTSIPEHGDIEYVLEYNGYYVNKVFCWDCDRDKKFIGDTECGHDSLNFIDKTWDDVLEYYGFTQGEYVEFSN